MFHVCTCFIIIILELFATLLHMCIALMKGKVYTGKVGDENGFNVWGHEGCYPNDATSISSIQQWRMLDEAS